MSNLLPKFNPVDRLNIDGVDMAEVCAIQEDDVPRIWTNGWWTLGQAYQLRDWLNRALPPAVSIAPHERHAMWVASLCPNLDITARNLLKQVYDRTASPK